MKHAEKDKINISFYLREASTKENPKRGVSVCLYILQREKQENSQLDCIVKTQKKIG